MRTFSLSLLLLGASCAREIPADPHIGQIVYVDTATDQPFAANISREVPAIHPETGKRTLVPGLYCSTCHKWYPGPPVEVLQRNPAAAKCPKGHGTMSTEGPWP